MRATIAVATLTLAMFSTSAFAQTPEEARETAKTVIADPGLSTTAAQPHSQLSLVSSNEGDTQVRAEISYSRATLQADWLYGLRIQGPLNKGGGETRLASLSGLGTGSTAGLHMTRIGHGKNFNPDAVAEACQEYDDKLPVPPRINVETECTLSGIEAKIDAWHGSTKQKEVIRAALATAVQAAAIKVCEAYNKSGTGPSILCDKTTDIRADFQRIGRPWPDKLTEGINKDLSEFCEQLNTDVSLWGFLGGLDGCDTDDIERVSKTFAADVARRVQSRPTFFSLGVDIQNQAFRYASGATLDETKETHQNFSASASYGRFFTESEWYIGLSAAIERVFEGGTAQQICGPITDTPLTTCKTISRTAPTHDDNEILTLEARHFISDNFAVQPRVSHDFSEGITGAELVLYFFKNKTKGLNGGVNIGYREDDEAPTLIVFIGLPFSLFGGD